MGLISSFGGREILERMFKDFGVILLAAHLAGEIVFDGRAIAAAG